MASSADIQAQIDDLNNKISKLSSGLSGAGQRTTYQAQIQRLEPQLNAARQAEERQQQEQQPQQQEQPQQQQEQQQPQPQQQATPISQVAPQAAGYQLPTLKQSIIDEQFKNRRTNELTSFNSDIRDQIYNAGWDQKSDAVRVLNGAGVYGIVSTPTGMGSTGYKSLSGKVATDQDFIDAAKAAGIDPNQYTTTTSNMGRTSTNLDTTKLYNALQEKGKDLYSVTNAIAGAERGDSAPHATALYKADGNGNLVVQNNPTTGQPDVKYFDAVRYANAPSFMDEFGPFLALAPAFGGILQANGIIPSFSSMFGGTTGALNAQQIAALTPDELAAYSGGGFAGGGYGSVGSAGYNASNALGAGLPLNQVGALTSTMTPAQVAALKTTGDVVAGGALANGIGMGVGSTAAGSALSNAFANNGLINALGAGAGALASYSGSQMQADAAKQAAANQMSMFNTINNQLTPQRGAGYSALNQIRSMLPGQYTTYGETGAPTGTAQGTDYLTRQFTPQDLQAGLAPNYNFMLGQGQQAQQRAANVGGGLIGGNALRGLEQYTQDYANNAYQNAFQNFNTQRTGIYNTLAGIAGIGQNATNTSANAGQNAVTAASQLGVGSAAAQAAGLQGVANAASGGLQNYQQNQILQAILGQNQNVAQYQNTASSFPNVA